MTHNNIGQVIYVKITLYSFNKLIAMVLVGLLILGIYLYISNVNYKIPEDALYVKQVLYYAEWRLKLWLL